MKRVSYDSRARPKRNRLSRSGIQARRILQSVNVNLAMAGRDDR